MSPKLPAALGWEGVNGDISVTPDKHGFAPYGAGENNSGTAFQFAARRIDFETGLYYNRARMYSTTLGRFLQPDPSGYAGGLNLYAYADDDPLDFTDPFGLAPDGPLGLTPEETQEFNAAYANGVSSSLGIVADFTPVVGAVKGVAEAVAHPTGFNIAMAAVGAIPEAGGIVKLGRDLEKLGDVGKIFYHYTNEAGAQGIKESGKILPNAKNQVFLTQERMSQEVANNTIFLGKGGDKGSYVVEIRPRVGLPIEPGKNEYEFIYQGLLRDGRNADFTVKPNGF